MRFLQDSLLERNHLIRTFNAEFERDEPQLEHLIIRSDRVPLGEHPRCFNDPTGNEVSILIVAEDDRAESREVII